MLLTVHGSPLYATAVFARIEPNALCNLVVDLGEACCLANSLEGRDNPTR